MTEIELEPGHFLIPDCCREGWDSCPHTPQRPKPDRKNIAL